MPWLDREFGWTEMTATRFINVYEMSKSTKLLDLELPISGLYLLAAPSTPKEARDQIIERAQAGETVPVAEVKRTIERTKGRKPPTQPQANTKSKDDVADNISVNSQAETERLRVRVAELQAEKRRLEIKIAGLESEIEELRGKLATETGGDMSISEFQTAHKKWEETFEVQRGRIAKLENENAKLRAGVAATPDDGLDIPESLRREPAR